MPSSWLAIAGGAVAALILAGQIFLAVRRRQTRRFLDRLSEGLGTERHGGKLRWLVSGRALTLDTQVNDDDRPEELRLRVDTRFGGAFRLTHDDAFADYADCGLGSSDRPGPTLGDWSGLSEDPTLLSRLAGQRAVRDAIDSLVELGIRRLELRSRELRVLWPDVSWSVEEHDWSSGRDSLPARVRRAAALAANLAASLEAFTFARAVPMRPPRTQKVFLVLVLVPLLAGAAGLATLIIGYGAYPPLRDEALLLRMSLAGALLTGAAVPLAWRMLRGGRQRGARTMVVALLSLLGFSLGSTWPILWWNGTGPQDAEARRIFEVVAIDISQPSGGARGWVMKELWELAPRLEEWMTTRRAIVRPIDADSSRSVLAIEVTKPQAELIESGDRLRVTVRPGALGMAWYSEVTLDDER